jgi:hypothetical protein
VRNRGGGELVWQAQASTLWILLSPERGLAPATLLVGIDARALQPGLHSGRVAVEAGRASASPQTIDVDVAITSPWVAGSPSVPRPCPRPS